MTRDLHPTDGARFLLLREQDLGTRAIYRVEIFTAGETFAARAEIADDGTALVHPTGAAAELDAMALMLARLLARGASKKREDGLPPWPSRVLRWRGPGRGE